MSDAYCTRDSDLQAIGRCLSAIDDLKEGFAGLTLQGINYLAERICEEGQEPLEIRGALRTVAGDK